MRKILGFLIFMMLLVTFLSTTNAIEKNEDKMTISLQPMPLYFGVKIVIKNTGNNTISDIDWGLKTEGGIFLRGGLANGSCERLKPDEELIISFNPFFGQNKGPRGFGQIEMEATANSSGIEEVRTTAEAFQLAFLTIFNSDEGDTVKYKVTFDSIWSKENHPDDFPGNPHFSGLIGASHNENVTFWETGELASEGIKNMAETGSKQPLDSEIQQAIDQGTAFKLLSGDGLPISPGSVNLTFKVKQSHPLVTLVTMIAPSPDWFVGVNSLNLYENASFLDEKIVVLYAYDSGTDSGESYESPDDPTNPPVPIFKIEGYPFFYEDELVYLGTLTFTKI